MLSGKGVVKACPSGDTVVVMGAAAGGPPPEKQITLEGIMAPRLGRKGGAADEPFAWESREFLRKLVIGKQVHFRIANPGKGPGGREFGTVYLEEENITHAIVQNGFAKVKAAPRDGGSE
eukprot:GFYU01021812.1.p2 GENE.GFYU01021812.1~~GFYU01021812.1.p2  ORF type:complete len:136 (+),score=37.84 GFYU01021812.1:49-408(+)